MCTLKAKIISIFAKEMDSFSILVQNIKKIGFLMLCFRASNPFMVRNYSGLKSGIYTIHISGFLAHTKFTSFPAALKLPKLFAQGKKCLGASRCLLFGFRRAWWEREKTHAVVINSDMNIDTKTQLSTFTRAETCRQPQDDPKLLLGLRGLSWLSFMRQAAAVAVR
jgi:hypothetical protein